MKYQATIHTMEIQPILGAEYYDKPGQWIRDIYRLKHPCIGHVNLNRYDGTVRVMINTHRYDATSEGKYIFSYKRLSQHLEDMASICEDLEIDGYIIRRMDLYLDTDAPYGQTQKLTRLIALMLGNEIGAINRYTYNDPFTLDKKALYLENGGRDANGNKIQPTHTIEHYNRELVDQMDYAGKPIRNHFELRSMGRAAGTDTAEGDITLNWIKRLEGLTERDMENVQRQLNQMILRECGNVLSKIGKTTPQMVNHYLGLCAADHIYSRRQLVELLDMLGRPNPESDAKNLLKTDRFGGGIERYSWAKVRAEIWEMKTALAGFLETA